MGIVTDVKPLHMNAKEPIEVTLFGIVIEVKPLQYENAEEPIEVTLLGIIVDLQPEIRVLVSLSIIALQSSRESYLILPSSTIILVNPLPENASSPIDVTLFGIVIEVKPLQSENAEEPIDVTLLGIVIEVNPLQ